MSSANNPESIKFPVVKNAVIWFLNLTLNLYSLFLLSLFFTDYSFLPPGILEKFKVQNGISNFSVQALVFIFLLLTRWLISRSALNKILFVRLLRKFFGLKDSKILFFIFLFFTLLISVIGIARHFSFSSAGCDMGSSDQAIWNTIKGRFLFSSLIGNVNHLGAHFEPILLLISPLYFIWPNIIILILLQAFSIGAAIFPLYLIARHRLNNRFLVFGFIFSYFLSRPIRGVALLDFHTDSFLVPLIFFSYYFLISKKNILAAFSLLLMLLCKEDVNFLIIGFGIFIAIYQRRYVTGLVLAATGAVGWLVTTNVIMPFFAHTKSYIYTVWLPFGRTYSQNISAVVNNPGLLVNLFFTPEKFNFYIRLFAPLAFLSFFSPQHYVLFLVPLLEHILGSLRHPGMQTISSHYPAHTMPFIFISAIYGAAWILDRVKGSNAKKIAPILLSCILAILSLAFYGKSDGHRLAKFFRGAKEIASKEIISDLRVIPKDASVCAVHRLVPHLSHRKYIYIWPGLNKFKYNTQYVVIYKPLIETKNDVISDILLSLKEKGYNIVVSDRVRDFYIFYNPKIRLRILESEPGKIIDLVSEDGENGNED
jgi:uncharacterized membrane protein